MSGFIALIGVENQIWIGAENILHMWQNGMIEGEPFCMILILPIPSHPFPHTWLGFYLALSSLLITRLDVLLTSMGFKEVAQL
jgi:hypothetical protein